MPVTLDGAAADRGRCWKGWPSVRRCGSPRPAPHEREGHERYTAAPMIAEEVAIFERVTASTAARIPAGWSTPTGCHRIRPARWRRSPVAVAGAGVVRAGRVGQDHLVAGAAGGRARRREIACPAGRADRAGCRRRAGRGAGDAEGSGTVARMLADLRSGTLTLDAATVLIVDEAGMVGTPALRELLDAAGVAGTKTVLVGDPASAGPGQSSGRHVRSTRR